MKPLATIFLFAILMLLLPDHSNAQGTITDGVVSFSFGSPGSDVEGTLVDFNAGGQDHMLSSWWWFRRDGSDFEEPFSPPDTEDYTGNTATFFWGMFDGIPVEVTLVVTITDMTPAASAKNNGGGAAAVIEEELSIFNTNDGPNPLNIEVFKYADINVAGTAGDDNAALIATTPNTHIRVTDQSTSDVMDFGMFDADAYQVSTPTTVRDLLNDMLVSNDLNNTGLPLNNADFTGAFQRGLSVLPEPVSATPKTRETVVVRVVTTLNAAPGLPVELASFDASIDHGSAQLRWETVTEKNNAGFEVQHAYLDRPFRAVGWVDGAGTTTEAQSYSFKLEDISYGSHRFRLKQIDFDGTVDFSSTVEVNYELPDGFVMSDFYPNPFNPQGRFTLITARDQQVSIQVYDLLGRLVDVLHNGELTGQQLHSFTFGDQNLPSGTYLIQIRGESFQAQQKILLIK